MNIRFEPLAELFDVEMGKLADWYDFDSAQRCTEEKAWFALFVMEDFSGRIASGNEVKKVVGGPYPTYEEAFEVAEDYCRFDAEELTEDEIEEIDEIVEDEDW